MSSSKETGVTLELTPDAATQFVSKASAFRGVLEALDARGELAAVRARVSPEVQRYIDAPPLAISWMPGAVIQYVLLAYAQLASLEAVRTLGTDSVIRGPLKAMKPVVEGILRLFGAEPMAFYRRLPGLLASQLRGVTFDIVEASPRSVAITVTFAHLRHVPMACFVYWEGVLSSTWGICRVTGTAQTTRVDVPEGNRGLVEITWVK